MFNFRNLSSMRRLLLSLLLLIIYSCEENHTRYAEGGKLYGGTFRFMSQEKVTALFPVTSFDTYTSRMISQLFDPLLRLDFETMEIAPSIVTSYAISADKKKFVLKIRKGIRFHDDPCFKDGLGRVLTVEDVKYSLEFACSGLKINRSGYLLIDKIVGAQEFYDKSSESLPNFGVSGIEIIDENTLQINLMSPNFEFDKILTLPSLSVFPREAFEMYKDNILSHPVGTGPFALESMNEKGIVLKRNNHYWMKDDFGNRLPFLDKLQMLYTEDKRNELLAFRQKKIDLVLNIPVEEIDHVLGSLEDAQQGKNVHHKIQTLTGMNVHYIGFAYNSKEFNDINVRKAFNYAIDRNYIVNDYLLGEGTILNGVVPLSDVYPAHSKVKGYEFNPQKARELLAKAGYPNGKNFPVLELYINPLDIWKGKKMSASILEQLKRNLNITLKVKLCDLAGREAAIKAGKAKIWKSGWTADYPSAENFLSLFYTGKNKQVASEINEFSFKSEKFDQAYEKALREPDDQKRAALFALCDQIVVDEAAVIPVMSKDYTMMVNARVRDFKQSAVDAMNFTTIYIKEQRIKKS